MLDFVQAHWTDIMATISAVLLLGHAVVKLTPSKADDELLAKIEGIVTGVIGGANKPKV